MCTVTLVSLARKFMQIIIFYLFPHWIRIYRAHVGVAQSEETLYRAKINRSVYTQKSGYWLHCEMISYE